MKKLSFFALLCALFVFAPQVHASGAAPFLVCTMRMPGLSDYIDYIPGEYVIQRGFEFDAAGNFVRYCSFDTLAVSDLLLRGEYETDIIGMIDDTLMTVCDSATVVDYFQSRYGHRYYADEMTVCNGTDNFFSVLPIEALKNEFGLPVDTLAAFVDGKRVYDSSATPGLYGKFVKVPLERGDLVRFHCNSVNCYAVFIDWTYVESGDSVLLCHKDSVLRRNGVCLDMQALRDTAGSVNVRPFPKEGEASVDSAPRLPSRGSSRRRPRGRPGSPARRPTGPASARPEEPACGGGPCRPRRSPPACPAWRRPSSASNRTGRT